MKCAITGNEANYICKFCGRAISEEVVKFKPYVTAAYDEKEDNPKVIAVKDAAWCGKCHPEETPVEMPEIE